MEVIMDRNVVFANKAVNVAANKPLTMENWNEFVRVLKASTLHLPVSYEWMAEYSDANEFSASLAADASWQVADKNEVKAMMLSFLLLTEVALIMAAQKSISFFLWHVFDLSSMTTSANK